MSVIERRDSLKEEMLDFIRKGGNSWIELCETYYDDPQVKELLPEVHESINIVIENLENLERGIGYE